MLKNSPRSVGKERYSQKLCKIHWKTIVCRSLFYNEGAHCMDSVKLLRSYFTWHRCFPVKSAKFLRTLSRTNQFTNNSVKHLRTGARVKLLWKSFESLCEKGDDFLWQRSSFITNTIFKRKYKSKKSIKSQPMCHAHTCVPQDIRDEKILKFSLLIADTIGTKKNCPLIIEESAFSKVGQYSRFFL